MELRIHLVGEGVGAEDKEAELEFVPVGHHVHDAPDLHQEQACWILKVRPTWTGWAFIAFSGASNLRGAEEVDRPDIQSFVCLRFDRWLGEVERLKVSAQDHVLLHLKTICYDRHIFCGVQPIGIILN